MPALSRIRTKQNYVVPRLNGMASRGRSLRILFIHSNATEVDRCVRELSAANFKVTADVVPDSEQFTKRVGSKVYDIVLAKHPFPDWRGTPALELMQQPHMIVPPSVVTDQLPLPTGAERM